MKVALFDIAVKGVCSAKPEVFAHNMETVARLHATVRPQAKYERSLQVLELAKKLGMTVKSGIMVGLGETKEEVAEVMRDLVNTGCELFTIGQYLQPSPKHLPVKEFVQPEVYLEYKHIGEALGLKHVQAGAMVRSSYRAETQEQFLRSSDR